MERFALLLFFLATSWTLGWAQIASGPPEKPFVVEYYYKAARGHADEFLRLFKKNHYPVLKRQVEMGRMVKVWVDQPRDRATEEDRWDYRVTVVFKNAVVANEPFDESVLRKQLFPDQETYVQEEKRRFEILDAHWEVPVKTVDLEGQSPCFRSSKPDLLGIPRHLLGKGTLPPRLTSKPEPEYDEQSRRARIQGTVFLLAVLDVDGELMNVHPVDSSGYSLNESRECSANKRCPLPPSLVRKAVENVWHWEFEPACKDGHGIPTTLTVEVSFLLY